MRAWTRRRCRYGLAAGLAAIVCSGVGWAQAPDPAFGVWKLDTAKSKFSPGPGPKSGTLTIEAAGTGRKVSVDGVSATGAALNWSYTANFDGKDATVTGANPDADTVVLKRLSPRSVQTTSKKNGKVTVVNTATVSAGGKTMTVVQEGTNAQGQKVHNTLILERQK
jgi:hypothetical protein